MTTGSIWADHSALKLLARVAEHPASQPIDPALVAGAENQHLFYLSCWSDISSCPTPSISSPNSLNRSLTGDGTIDHWACH
jgi:hypothetical protein